MKKLFLTFVAVVVLHSVNFAGNGAAQTPRASQETEGSAVSSRQIYNVTLTSSQRSATIYFNEGIVTGASASKFSCSYGAQYITISYSGDSYAQEGITCYRMIPITGQPPLTVGETIFVTFQPDPIP